MKTETIKSFAANFFKGSIGYEQKMWSYRANGLFNLLVDVAAEVFKRDDVSLYEIKQFSKLDCLVNLNNLSKGLADKIGFHTSTLGYGGFNFKDEAIERQHYEQHGYLVAILSPLFDMSDFFDGNITIVKSLKSFSAPLTIRDVFSKYEKASSVKVRLEVVNYLREVFENKDLYCK